MSNLFWCLIILVPKRRRTRWPPNRSPLQLSGLPTFGKKWRKETRNDDSTHHIKTTHVSLKVKAFELLDELNQGIHCQVAQKNRRERISRGFRWNTGGSIFWTGIRATLFFWVLTLNSDQLYNKCTENARYEAALEAYQQLGAATSLEQRNTWEQMLKAENVEE